MSASDVLGRFFAKVSEPCGDTGCWVWLGGMNDVGYGQFSINHSQALFRRTIGAHVFMLILVSGEDSNGREAMHSCDIPWCVRPDHLRWGTRSDNMQDKVSKGRHVYVGAHPGEQHHAARLTPPQVEAIRASTESQRVLATRYGISQQHVSRIKRGEKWRSPSAL